MTLIRQRTETRLLMHLNEIMLASSIEDATWTCPRCGSEVLPQNKMMAVNEATTAQVEHGIAPPVRFIPTSEYRTLPGKDGKPERYFRSPYCNACWDGQEKPQGYPIPSQLLEPQISTDSEPWKNPTKFEADFTLESVLPWLAEASPVEKQTGDSRARGRERVLKDVDRALQFMVNPEKDHILALVGYYGVGKTHLAKRIFIKLVREHRMSGKFVNMESWLDQLRASYGNNQQSLPPTHRIFSPWDVVVLDDIDKMREVRNNGNIFAHDIALQVLEARVGGTKPKVTIITLNRLLGKEDMIVGRAPDGQAWIREPLEVMWSKTDAGAAAYSRIRRTPTTVINFWAYRIGVWEDIPMITGRK